MALPLTASAKLMAYPFAACYHTPRQSSFPYLDWCSHGVQQARIWTNSCPLVGLHAGSTALAGGLIRRHTRGFPMPGIGLLHLLLRPPPAQVSSSDCFANRPVPPPELPFGPCPPERCYVANGRRSRVQSVVYRLALWLRSTGAVGIFKTQVPNPRCISPGRPSRGQSAAHPN